MVRPNPEALHGCPINYASAVLGDRWALLILRDLAFKGARRYADFLSKREGISTNILADRLDRLERAGVVAKSKDPDHATRPLYGLTEKGRALIPVLLEIIAWSVTFDTRTEVPETYIDALRNDRATLLKSHLDALAATP